MPNPAPDDEVPVGPLAARFLTFVLPGLGHIGRDSPGTGLAFALGAIALAGGGAIGHMRGHPAAPLFSLAYLGWLLAAFLHLGCADRPRDPARQRKRLLDAWAWGVRREGQRMDRLLDRALTDDPGWMAAHAARIWCARQSGEFVEARRLLRRARAQREAAAWSDELDALDAELRGIEETML